MPPGLITRHDWQAERALFASFLDMPVLYIFTTFDTHVSPCYSTKKCQSDIQFLQRSCMRFGKLPDIQYNFLITGHGKILEGRGWIYSPGLPVRYKKLFKKSIWVGFMGNFTKNEPPRSMYYAKDSIIKAGVKKGFISPKAKNYPMYYVHRSSPVQTGKYRIISRDEWGAVDPLWVKFLTFPVEHVFFEYTNTEECRDRTECAEALRALQRYNLKLRSNPDIRYNFLIAPDGTVYEGRGWDASPRLPMKYEHIRKNAIYIALIGNYTDHAPSENMFQARVDLVHHGVSLKHIKEKHLEYSLASPRLYAVND